MKYLKKPDMLLQFSPSVKLEVNDQRPLHLQPIYFIVNIGVVGTD